MIDIICPVCRAKHERIPDNRRTIFCRCGSAAHFSSIGWNPALGMRESDWHWFRLAVRRKHEPPATQTEIMQTHGPEIDL